MHDDEPIRLNKVIAQAGFASRRGADDLIRRGEVRVNGVVVTELGTKVDLRKDRIQVSGKRLRPPEPKVYLALYKPRNMITSMSDEPGKDRPLIADLLRDVKVRVFPVGRLDFDVEGLILCTNDGTLAHRLMHPRYHVPKCYWVKVKGVPEEKALARLRRGVELEDGKTAPARVILKRKTQANAWLDITVHEGRNHLIKRMVEAVGHPALKIIRFSFAGILLSDLTPGAYRFLAPSEISFLKRLVSERKGK